MILIKRIMLILLFLFIELNASSKIIAKLDTILIIGDNENAPNHYIFAWPLHICTDTNNNIYVADRNSMKIRVFDENGHFLKYIGRRGQGPGEMQDIVSMTIDNDDNLIIADRINHRLTMFFNMGEDFQVYPIPIKLPITPRFIASYKSNKYLLFFHLRSHSKYRIHKEDKIFHVFDNKFASVIHSFGRAGDIWNFENGFSRSRVGKKGISMLISNTDQVIISPWFYEGKLFCYCDNSNKEKLSVFKGKKIKKAYELLDKRKLNKKNLAGCISGHKYTARLLSINKGLFCLKDGTIVHFIWLREKSNTELGVEFFKHTGEFIGYGKIASADIEDKEQKELVSNLFNFRVLWKDTKDFFYCRILKNGFPVILKAKLNYKME